MTDDGDDDRNYRRCHSDNNHDGNPPGRAWNVEINMSEHRKVLWFVKKKKKINDGQFFWFLIFLFLLSFYLFFLFAN